MFLYVHVCIGTIEAYICAVVVTLWSAMSLSSTLFYVYSFFCIISTTIFLFTVITFAVMSIWICIKGTLENFPCLSVSLVSHFAPVPGYACLCIHIHFCTKVWAWDASLVILHAWVPQGIRRFSLKSSLCQLEATSLGKYVHKTAQQGWWLKYDWQT